MEETRICKVCGRELSINEFAKNGMGITHVCRECVANRKRSKREETKMLKEQAANADSARLLRLQDFTPRELMKRLYDLGYRGQLKYVRTEIIDIAKL
jgi:ribosome-binding protein aMBF1 (putative translation factor)